MRLGRRKPTPQAHYRWNKGLRIMTWDGTGEPPIRRDDNPIIWQQPDAPILDEDHAHMGDEWREVTIKAAREIIDGVRL